MLYNEYEAIVRDLAEMDADHSPLEFDLDDLENEYIAETLYSDSITEAWEFLGENGGEF